MPRPLCACLVALLLSLAGPMPAPAQEQPARPDTTRADSLRGPAAPADSLRADSTRRDRLRRGAITAARDTARTWLGQVDAGRYDTTWAAADSLFSARISQADWAGRGRAARQQLRGLRARRFVEAHYRDSVRQLPGRSPVVVLQYRTAFEGGITDEIVLAAQADSTWAVAGYRVVPANQAAPPPDSVASPADSLAAPSDTTGMTEP